MEFSEFIRLGEKHVIGQAVTLVETSNGIQPFPIVLQILRQIKKLERKVTCVLLGTDRHVEKYLVNEEKIDCSELIRHATDLNSFLAKFGEIVANIPSERTIAFDDISVLTSMGLSCYEAVQIVYRLIRKNSVGEIILGATTVVDDEENSLFLGHLRTFSDNRLVARALSSGKCKEITGTLNMNWNETPKQVATSKNTQFLMTETGITLFAEGFSNITL